MLKLLSILCAWLLLFSCIEEEELYPALGNNSPIDTGDYIGDSTKSDAFCDFEFLANTQNCWDPSISVSRDCHYNLLFTRYNNGWTGSDATYSIGLPDGRILWMFGDTFLGRVRADRTRAGSPFLRNSLIVQEGDEMRTLYQIDDAGNPTAYFVPDNPEHWYWPLDGTIHNGEIQIMLGRLSQTGSPGMWSFQYVGFDLATISLDDFSLSSITPVLGSGEISYGSSIMEDDTHMYIYGISTSGLGKRLHVARVPQGDLQGDWEYYGGLSWQNTPSKFAIHATISDQFSVFKEGGKYYLMTQQSFFSDKILLYQSDTPIGPWTNKKILYCTPETEGNVFTYNAFVHPELSENGELRISYNINSFNFQDLFDNADLYRPYFIRVDNWQ